MRDLLLGRVPLDLDLATPQPEAFARQLAELIGGTPVLLDDEHVVWRVALRERMDIDCCAFRDSDIVGDLHGRDFTFNAMAIRLPEPDAPRAR